MPYVCTHARIYVAPGDGLEICRFCPFLDDLTAYNTEGGKMYHLKINAVKTPKKHQRKDLKKSY